MSFFAQGLLTTDELRLYVLIGSEFPEYRGAIQSEAEARAKKVIEIVFAPLGNYSF